MVFADMYVRSERAERVAAQACAIAAETRADIAEMWHAQAEVAKAMQAQTEEAWAWEDTRAAWAQTEAAYIARLKRHIANQNC